MEEEIFKKSEINSKKLIEYGFKQINDFYYFEKLIVDNNFKVEIIYKDNRITGKIIDNEIGEELLNYRVLEKSVQKQIIIFQIKQIE